MPDGCRGITPAVIPAAGNVAGQFWTAPALSGTCVGTVTEFVRYPGAGTLTWRVIAFTRSDAGGQTLAAEPVTADRAGNYDVAFGIHAVISGLTRLCVTAVSPQLPASLACASAGDAAPPQQFTQLAPALSVP